MPEIRGAVGLGFTVVVLAVVTQRGCALAEVPGEDVVHPALGLVDIERTSGTDEALEALVAEERYVTAMSLAVSGFEQRFRSRGHDDLSTLAALRRVGVVAHLAGDQRLAASVFDALLPPLRAAGAAARLELVETLIRRGYTARYQNERARAAGFYDEARHILRDGGVCPGALEAYLEHANADWSRIPDRERAIRLYEAALRLRGETPGVPWISIAENRTWAAFSLARAGRWDEARTHVEEARRILRRIGVRDHSLYTTLDEISAQDLALRGRPDEALIDSVNAAERSERVRRRHAPGLPRSEIISEAANALAVRAIERGDGDAAWGLRERGLGSVHAELAWLGRADEHDPAAARAMRSLGREVLEATRLWDEGSSARAEWSSERAKRLEALLVAKARLDETRSAYLDAHPVPEPDVTRIRQLLDERSAMVGWLEVYLGDAPTDSTRPTKSTGWAFVIRRDRPIQWVRLFETEGEKAWLACTDFRRGMSRMVRAASWPEPVAADPEMLEGLARRGRLYFEPIRAYLRGIDRLVVDGDVYLLPEMFVGDGGRYVTDDFEVVHVPSAATLDVLSRTPASRSARGESLLAIAAGRPVADPPLLTAMLPGGDAVTKRGGRTTFTRRDVAIGDLPPLPFATVETAAVAAVFPSATRLEGDAGNDSRLDALASSGRLDRFDVIHVAGHALSDPAPERAAIVIATRASPDSPGTEGLLSVEDEALSWRIGARLVTFSACQSGVAGGSSTRGEPLGFPPASLGAGAPSVLSSVWPVDDRATAILMRRFYENLTGRYEGVRRGRRGAPMPISTALAEAKIFVRELPDATGGKPYEHPSYWAGWVLIGTGE